MRLLRSAPRLRARLCVPFFVFIVASQAGAQTSTWVVDAAGGPGSHFTSLVAAEAAAADGDTLLVRPGTYQGFETSKGLTVLGERLQFSGTRITPPSGARHTVRVHNLPAGQSFRMAACDVRRTMGGGLPGAYGSAVRVEHCLGSVLLDDVLIEGFATDSSAGLSAAQAAHLQITGCEIEGLPAYTDRGGSSCTVVASTLTGMSAITGLGGFPLSSAAPGVDIANFDGPSTMRLVRSTVRGGDGVMTSILAYGGAPAVLLHGTLIVSGDASTQLVAGNSPAAGMPVDCVATGLLSVSGIASVDPAVSVLGSGGGAPFSAGITATRPHVPWLVASGEGPGGQVAYTLGTTPNNPVSVILSLPALPIPTPFGDFELNSLAIFPLYSGTQPATGLQSQSLTVPQDPGLLGSAFAVQAAVFDLATNALSLTNSAQFLLY